MNSGSLVGMLAVIFILGGPFCCGIVSIICCTVEKVSRQRAEANLKSQLIQRGFSAAEIERILSIPIKKPGKKHRELMEAPQPVGTPLADHWQPIIPPKPAPLETR